MRTAAGIPGVCSANSIVTVQLAPSNVMATLSLDFFDYMRAPDIERAVVELEKQIRKRPPGGVGAFRQTAKRGDGGRRTRNDGHPICTREIADRRIIGDG